MVKTRAQRGFTLIEIMVVVVIVVILAALTIIAAGSFVRSSRFATEQVVMRNLAMGIEQFEQRLGFAPPLVNDEDPVNPRSATEVTVRIRGESTNQALVGNPEPALKYLSYENTNFPETDPRYSELSIPYYIMGVCGKTVDGVDGPGMTTPLASPVESPWRSFAKSGSVIQPFFDPGADKTRLEPRNADGSLYSGANPERQTRFLDRWNAPVRFYRWEPLFHVKGTAAAGRTGAPANQPTQAGEIRDYNAPLVLGDPRNNPSLRSAKWAIISKGPDGVLNDQSAADRSNVDNVMIIDGGSAVTGGGT